jgi:hypothetical protein
MSHLLTLFFIQPKLDSFGYLPWESGPSSDVSSQSHVNVKTPKKKSSVSGGVLTADDSSAVSAPNINLLTDLRYRYTCTAIRTRHHPYGHRRRGWRHPPSCVTVEDGVEKEVELTFDRVVGFARRRRGRGGRNNLDRGWTPADDLGLWERIPPLLPSSGGVGGGGKLDTAYQRDSAAISEPTNRHDTTTVKNECLSEEGFKLKNGLPSTAELNLIGAAEW